MTRTRRCLVLAAALACAATDAAAQPVGGALEVPLGQWEYRWLTRNDARGVTSREPASGVLDLRDNGWHTHRRDAGGTTVVSTGTYRVQEYLLFLPRTDMANGRMVQDTFQARRIGGWMFLWQRVGGETLEYTLAPPGAPEQPPVVPGIVPSIYGFARPITFFETPGPVPPPSRRRYATEFRADSARFINVQVNLSHPLPLADQTVVVACTILDARDAVTTLLEWTTTVRPGNAGSGTANGWGTDVPGIWHPGTYRVRCTVDGVAVPEGSFLVR